MAAASGSLSSIKKVIFAVRLTALLPLILTLPAVALPSISPIAFSSHDNKVNFT